MGSERKLAIFDFDDTIFNGQSFTYFVSFLENQLPVHKYFMAKLRKRLLIFLNIDERCRKEFLIKPFRHFTKHEIEQLSEKFYREVILNRLHSKLLSEIHKCKEENFLLVLASGGFGSYLDYFVKEFGFDYSVTSEFLFDGMKFTGNISGDEVLGENKKEKLCQFFINDKISWKQSILYSDHISDLPSFSMVGHRVVVVKDETTPHWIAPDFKLLYV